MSCKSNLPQARLDTLLWVRGARHVAFSTAILKINARTSVESFFLLTGFRAREVVSRQYKRKLARCQQATVSGVTTTSEFFRPPDVPDRHSKQFVEGL